MSISNHASTRSSGETSTLNRPRAWDTILFGGLAVGVLDALDAIIFFGLQGVAPVRIFQHIASGLLGRASFGGGSATALLGLLLHFLIAFILAAIYYGASLRFPTLIRRAVLCGLLYGVAVYFVMNYLVVPLSAAPNVSASPAVFLNGLLAHALLVGLPIALLARRSAQAK
ncbi:MAG: hypothetical protein M3430_17370 [Acidobacteriota bacterium]|nr:hypothetical protein [Acidobacteriota bacterium]